MKNYKLDCTIGAVIGIALIALPMMFAIAAGGMSILTWILVLAGIFLLYKTRKDYRQNVPTSKPVPKKVWMPLVGVFIGIPGLLFVIGLIQIVF